MLFEACGEGNGQNAVTRVAWSPCGLYLYAARRRDAAVRCWDARKNSDGCVYEMRRVSGSTNQKIGFDVEPCGRHMVSGGTDGVLRAFDLRDGTEKAAWRACDASEAVSDFAFHPHASWGEPGTWPRRSPRAARPSRGTGASKASSSKRTRRRVQPRVRAAGVAVRSARSGNGSVLVGTVRRGRSSFSRFPLRFFFLRRGAARHSSASPRDTASAASLSAVSAAASARDFAFGLGVLSVRGGRTPSRVPGDRPGDADVEDADPLGLGCAAAPRRPPRPPPEASAFARAALRASRQALHRVGGANPFSARNARSPALSRTARRTRARASIERCDAGGTQQSVDVATVFSGRRFADARHGWRRRRRHV